MFGTRLLRYLSPSFMQVVLSGVVQPFEQLLKAYMSLQPLGVNHIKLGAELEFRSLTSAQSVTVQPLGLASAILLQRAEFVVMSWKAMNPLCMGSYGLCVVVSQPAATFWSSM